MLGWLPLAWLPSEWQRHQLVTAAPTGSALADYLQQSLPSATAASESIEYLALDFETTGLKPHEDRIVSMGWVVIRNEGIRLNDAQHLLIRPDSALAEDSVTVHGITDAHAEAGMSEREALDILLSALKGRVLLAHHVEIEAGFLRAACERQYHSPLPFQNIDTLKLSKRVLSRKTEGPFAPGALRLFNLRERYGLPRYRPHSALEDALSAAELFLALLAEIRGNSHSVRLKQLLS
jgi:DNA polymerase-3 subunit epsilon